MIQEWIYNMTTDRKIPTFLCHKTFDDTMLSEFVSFYNKCIASKATDAIIYINSPGGYVSVLDSMTSLMESTQINFHTVAIGWACSCGLLLLAAGDVRYATDRAEIMFHDIAGGSHGHPDQIIEDVSRIKSTSKRVIDKFAKRTKKNANWWMGEYIKNPNRTFWFDAKKALSLGVIDYIGVPQENVKQLEEVKLELIRV